MNVAHGVHAGPAVECGNDTVTYLGNCTDGSAVGSGQLYYAGTASEVKPPSLVHSCLPFFSPLLFLGLGTLIQFGRVCLSG